MITMPGYSNFVCLILLSLFAIKLAAQTKQSAINKKSGYYFVETGTGLQMSGIKNEDFIPSNYSPLLKIVAGKWISPEWGFQLGYKGPYFNTISDSLKHYYTYIYGEILCDSKALLNEKKSNRFWSVLIHAGPGYFYNEYYDKPNVCGNLGIQNNFRLTQKLQANFDISSIVGWDIYQGDKDILPGISGGFVFTF